MRRRAQPRDAQSRLQAPLYVTQINHALREFHRLHPGKDGSRIPAGFGPWRQKVRDDWCRENGCWRVGKTCEQVGVKPCEGRLRAEAQRPPAGPAGAAE